MFLVDLPDGTNVRWDTRMDFSVRNREGAEIDHFTHQVTRSAAKSPSISQARLVALRHLRRNQARLGIVVPQL